MTLSILLNFVACLFIETPSLDKPIDDAGVRKMCRLQVYTEVYYTYPPQNDSTATTEIHSIDVKKILFKEGYILSSYDNASSIVKSRHKYIWKKYHMAVLDEIKSFALTYKYKSQRTPFSKVIFIQPSPSQKKRIGILKKSFPKTIDPNAVLTLNQKRALYKLRNESLDYICNEIIPLTNYYLIEVYNIDNPPDSYTLYAYSPSLSVLQVITEHMSYLSTSQEDREMIDKWLDNKRLSSKPENSIFQEAVTVFFVHTSSNGQIAINSILSGYKNMF